MKCTSYSVTYEIVTPESAEHGDAEERGYIEEACTLRDAVSAVRKTRTNEVDGISSIECDSNPCVRVRWITVYNGTEYRTGAQESRSLHIPHHITDASSRRLARLIGARV